MDWIQQWQSKLNKQNGVAPLVRTGGSRHTGLAALPYRNIQSARLTISDSTQAQTNSSRQNRSRRSQQTQRPVFPARDMLCENPPTCG